MNKINFIDLHAQQVKIRSNIEGAINTILDHGVYINGPEVKEIENNLIEFCGAKHALSCANGTDALILVLLAKNIKAGDAVFIPSYTFTATAEAVALVGATPVFVDVDKISFNMHPDSLLSSIEVAKKHNLQPKAIIAVDLFGRPADYEKIDKIAKMYDLWVLCDAAQSFGSQVGNKKVGTFGLATTTSFFPAKPLGCYGDGGCIFTDDDNLAQIITSIKSHGMSSCRSEFIKLGINSRLDSFQAAVLIEKLKVFPQELQHRQSVANSYAELLHNKIITPGLPSNVLSTWAQYTIILPETVNRDDTAAKLKEKGIPTAIYYAKPLHQQTAYQCYAYLGVELPHTEYLSKHVLSLPMDGYLTLDKIKYITQGLNNLII